MAITFRLSTKFIIKFTISNILHSLESETEQIFRRILFISNQLTSPLASTLRSYGITPSLYNNNNLGSQLINNKIDKIDKLGKSGVYKLTCHDCDALYRSDRSLIQNTLLRTCKSP